MKVRILVALVTAMCLSSCGGDEIVELTPEARKQVKRVMVVRINSAFNGIWIQSQRADTTGITAKAEQMADVSRGIPGMIRATGMPQSSVDALSGGYLRMAEAAGKLAERSRAGDIDGVKSEFKAIRANHCNGCHLPLKIRKI